MKVLYIILLVVGLILLLATEGSLTANIIGLILFAFSASKLGVFDDNQVERYGNETEVHDK